MKVESISEEYITDSAAVSLSSATKSVKWLRNIPQNLSSVSEREPLVKNTLPILQLFLCHLQQNQWGDSGTYHKTFPVSERE